jgi:Fe(3+) dicitrate transport protein
MKQIILLPILLSLTLTTRAQESLKDSLSELSEVTIIGNKVRALSGSGEIVTSKKLAKLNQPDITKVLRTVPGVNIRDEEGFGLRPNIGLRGTPVNRSAKITVMEDGILMAPAPYSDPSAYYFPTFARMESVEVLKGSSQIKYGPYTIGGALNMVSTAIPQSFKGFAQAAYGSFGTNQQRVYVGDSRKNFDYLFEFNRLASNGFKDLDNGGNTGFDRRDVMGKLRWHTSENARIAQSVTLKFVNSTEKGDESYLGLTYNDFLATPNRRYATTQKDLLDMTHQHVSLNHLITPFQNFSLSTTAYYTRTFRDWGRVNSVGGQSVNVILSNPSTHATPYQVMTGKANGNVIFQNAARTFTTRGIQANAQYFFQTGALKHIIKAGVRVHEDEADRYATQSTFTMTNGTMILATAGIQGNNENQIRHANSTATYLQYDLNYKNLTITPGIRYERIQFEFSNFGTSDYGRLGTALKTAKNNLTIALPGIGFNYSVTSKMSAFGGVHKGFSPPGMPSTTSAEQAQSETAMNYELGYRYHHQDLEVQTVGFLNNYANILGSDNMSSGGLGTGNLFNAGNATVQGLEMSISYNLMSKLNNMTDIKLPFSVAYTYTDARFRETFVNAGGDWGSGTINQKDLIPFITPHLFTGSLGIENSRFDMTLVSRFVGDTRTKPGQDEAKTPENTAVYGDVNTIGQYWVFDLSGNYKLSKNFTIYGIVNNVFNNTYIVANLPQGYRPGMPFAVNAGVKVTF